MNNEINVFPLKNWFERDSTQGSLWQTSQIISQASIQNSHHTYLSCKTSETTRNTKKRATHKRSFQLPF